jgi:DUF4097 and DUF4098 domain-containing protein YvlB
MMLGRSLRSGLGAALTLAALAAAAGCGMVLNAEAHDEWKRTYPLAQGGSVEIRNTNGRIQVEPGDDGKVEVVATRTARAGSDEEARAELKNIEIVESVSPNRIALDSAKGHIGIVFEFNVSRRVDYVVRVPRWANVTVTTTNGEIAAAGVAGEFRAETTNGAIKASEIDGAVRMETTNGDVTLEVTKVTDAGVTCATTNGSVDLTMPSAARASFDVSTSNGAIDPTGLDLKVSEQSRRALRATVGGGGPTIKLETTNGGIRVRGR